MAHQGTYVWRIRRGFVAPFRVTRNSNLYLAEEEAPHLLESVRTELHNRRKVDAHPHGD